MLKELFGLDRRLRISNTEISKQYANYSEIESIMDDYLSEYSSFNELDSKTILSSYQEFATIYSKNLKDFKATNKYPIELNAVPEINRVCYDIALILSCVTNKPRFEIASNLLNTIKQIKTKNICVVGAGAGLELELINHHRNGNTVDAFDLSFNPFVKQHFNHFNLRQEYFNPANCANKKYDVIFGVELLEHLAQPFALINDVYNSLNTGGTFICTTATNMPQFDHLINFTDIEGFKTKVLAIGFTIEDHKTFHQRYVFDNIDAKSDWFILSK